MKTKLNKKGQVFSQLGSLAVGIATLMLVLTVAFLVMSEGKERIQNIEGVNSTGQNSTGSYTSLAFNSTSTLQSATDDVPGWIPLVVIAVIGSILLGLVQLFRRNA